MASASLDAAGSHLGYVCKCVPCNKQFRSPADATEHFGSEEHKEVIKGLTSKPGKVSSLARFIRSPKRDRPLTEEEGMIRQRMMQPLIVCEENCDFTAFVAEHNLFTMKDRSGSEL